MTAVEHRSGSAVAAEWTKLTGLPRNRRTAAGAVALALLVAAVFCLTVEATTGVPLGEQTSFDLLTTGLLGVDAAALVLAVLAAASTGGEYATGMVRTTFTALPSRGRVLAARALTTAVFTGMVAVVAAVGTALVSLLVLAAAGLPTWEVTDPATWRVVFGTALMAPFHALVAVAFAALTRSTAGGVVAVLVLLVAPTLAGWIPGGAVVLPLLPGEAIHAVAGITAPGQASPHPVLAVALLAAWAVAALLLALIAVRRQDV